MNVLHAGVHYMCASCPLRSEESSGSPGAGLEGCELLYDVWDQLIKSCFSGRAVHSETHLRQLSRIPNRALSKDFFLKKFFNY